MHRSSSAPVRFSSMVAAAVFLLPWLNLFAGSNPPGFPAFSEKEYKPAGLNPKDPDIEIDFPGGASAHGAVKGTAVVGVLVGVEGKGLDYVVISCTEMAFGQKLLEQAQGIKYQPALFKGVAVPARFNLGYTFEVKSATVNPMEVARRRMEDAAGIKQVYAAVAEKSLDHELEFTNAVLPVLPDGYPAADHNPVKVFVTFYVDEDGHVRAPSVDSAAAPELIPGAVAAVLKWSFKPPTTKGKPALVYTGRPVRFMPR